MTQSFILIFIDAIFTIYTFMLIARIIGSWFPEIQENKIFQFICFYVDPYLNLFRRIIPPIGMLDISPIAAFFVLQLIEMFIKGILA